MLKLLDVSKYTYPVLAKPSGITLKQHRENVISEGELLAQYHPFTFQKYLDNTGKSLERRLELVCKFHDDGKEYEKWQKACQLDYENYLKWRERFGGNFQEFSEQNRNEAGKNLRQAGVRHEFRSLLFNEKKKLPICLQAAIAAHHGKLGFKYEDRWHKEGVDAYWKSFRRESNRILDESLDISKIAEIQYEFAGPRGLLQLSDHRASAIEDGEYVPPYNRFKYQFPHNQKRDVQKLIEENWEEELLLVRAPTGAGKTDASLLWASKQIENKRADRLVIAMPTRFTSNALAISVAEHLSDTGLYHSSAWFSQFHKDVESGEVERKTANKIHEFARLLQTPVTVCTIDHLLMSLTLTREDHHLITFNLANSCLVIDEADFYDDFTQANILVLLEILKCWKVPILLMSASLPESVLPLYQKIGYKVAEIKEDNKDDRENQRVRFTLKSIRNYSIPAEIEDLLELCYKKGNAIIYANTVERAMAFQNWFEEKKKATTCLYHSRFTEPDKKRKEETLIKMLGREAWQKGTAAGIAILTQIGEMSINISADLMISDVCPIDRLIQRTGRLCRFDKSKSGDLYLLIPEKNGKLYPAPYGEYDRKDKSWIPSDYLKKTKEVLKCESYNAEKLVKLLNIIYATESDFSIKAITNAKNLKEYFKYNWLITSKEITEKDDERTNFWTSRNIPPQEAVFVQNPESLYFNNYLSFQGCKLENSVELPVYLIKNAKKNSMIDVKSVTIKEEDENIYVIRNGFYSFEKGVCFTLGEPFL